MNFNWYVCLIGVICGFVFARLFRKEVKWLFYDLRSSLNEWLCAVARDYLMKHDRRFRRQTQDLELVQRRHAFYANGGRPSDPDCPNLDDGLG